MSETEPARSVVHDTFDIERRYRAAPSEVFAAWADPTAKAEWFAADDGGWHHTAFELDFRVGGSEHSSALPPDGGEPHVYDARFLDVVDDHRIVYAYEMHLGETRISASLATVQIFADGDGTRLTYTEQGAFLDGHDTVADRHHGMGAVLDALGTALGEQHDR